MNTLTKSNKYTTHGDTSFQRSVVYWDALMIGKSNLEMNQGRLQCWDASSEPEGPLHSVKLLFPGRAPKWYFKTACLAQVADVQRYASCSLLSEMPQDVTGYNVMSKMFSLELGPLKNEQSAPYLTIGSSVTITIQKINNAGEILLC